MEIGVMKLKLTPRTTSVDCTGICASYKRGDLPDQTARNHTVSRRHDVGTSFWHRVSFSINVGTLRRRSLAHLANAEAETVSTVSVRRIAASRLWTLLRLRGDEEASRRVDLLAFRLQNSISATFLSTGKLRVPWSSGRRYSRECHQSRGTQRRT